MDFSPLLTPEAQNQIATGGLWTVALLVAQALLGRRFPWLIPTPRPAPAPLPAPVPAPIPAPTPAQPSQPPDVIKAVWELLSPHWREMLITLWPILFPILRDLVDRLLAEQGKPKPPVA